MEWRSHRHLELITLKAVHEAALMVQHHDVSLEELSCGPENRRRVLCGEGLRPGNQADCFASASECSGDKKNATKRLLHENSKTVTQRLALDERRMRWLR